MKVSILIRIRIPRHGTCAVPHSQGFCVLPPSRLAMGLSCAIDGSECAMRLQTVVCRGRSSVLRTYRYCVR